MALRALAEGFRGRSSPEADHLVGAPLDDRIAMAVDLIDNGEPVVAFENLCSNLYEYELPISADEHQQLAALGEQSGALQTATTSWRNSFAHRCPYRAPARRLARQRTQPAFCAGGLYADHHVATVVG